MTTTAPLAPQPVPDAPKKQYSESDKRWYKHNSVWYWLLYGVSAGLLAVILGIAVAAVFLPHIVGAVPLTVLTRSMTPALPPGTMLIVRPVEAAQLGEIRNGDVISFQPYANDPTLITHRVTAIKHLQRGDYIFTTQGDANSHPDAPVHGIQVRAKLWYSIPLLGWVNDYINQRDNRTWIVPTVAGLLFVYAGWTVMFASVAYTKQWKARKAARTEGADADDEHPQPTDAP